MFTIFFQLIRSSKAMPEKHRHGGLGNFVKYKLNLPGISNFHLLPTARLSTQPLYVFSPMKKRIANIGSMQKQLNNLR